MQNQLNLNCNWSLIGEEEISFVKESTKMNLKPQQIKKVFAWKFDKKHVSVEHVRYMISKVWYVKAGYQYKRIRLTLLEININQYKLALETDYES